MKTSNCAAARRSNSPFLTPAHPASATVLTSWPGSSLRRARGTHSSSSTRIGNQVRLGLFKGCHCKLSRDGREVIKKFVQRMAARDVVNGCLYGNARADKHRRATQDVWVRMYDG